MYQGHYTLPGLNTQPTAHLAQTMTLLNMNTEELLQMIASEVASNPALEVDTARRCPSCGRELGPVEACPVCSVKKDTEDSDTVVYLSSLREFSADYSTPRQTKSDEDLDFEDFQAGELSLNDYVLSQLQPECSPLEYSIAEHLVSSLDDKGFITVTLFDIARYFHVSVEQVEQVKQKIQQCDPLGIGSANSIEAMQVQIHALAEQMEVPDLAVIIVDEFMEELLHRQLDEIGLNTEATTDEIMEAMAFIAANLVPFPANANSGSVRTPVKEENKGYYRPDAVVHYMNNDPEGGLSVEVVMPYVYQISVNPEFKKAMAEAPLIKQEKWEKDYDRASLLVKCLQQRAVTMLRLMQYLVDFQKEFILKGEKHLIPLTRARVAEILEVHESTISRAVAKKTMQLPNGKIIPLSTFFSRNMSVRCVLKEIIAQEEQPLSDSKLVLALKEQGYTVARRTVAKYRMMEGILPAHLRKSELHDQQRAGITAVSTAAE